MKTALILYLLVQCALGLWAVESNTNVSAALFKRQEAADAAAQRQKRQTPTRSATASPTQNMRITPSPTFTATTTPKGA